MSKTQDLRAKVRLMVADCLADPADYEKLCNNYRLLVQGQKVMKRPPKSFLRGDWLKDEVKNYVLEQYLQWSGCPGFYLFYEDCAEQRISGVMEELAKHMGYFHRDWWLTWPDRVSLHQRFRELNPKMARLNDLLEFIVRTPLIMRSEPFYKKHLQEFWKGIGKDIMTLLKLPKMQDILYKKSGVTFYTEGGELCSSAWSDNAGGVVSIFKQSGNNMTTGMSLGSLIRQEEMDEADERR